MRTKASNQNRFMRFITIPIRALGKARDFYVTDCAQRVSYGGAMGIQSGRIHNLPKSFSVSFNFIATLTTASRFQVPKKHIAGREDRNSILNWIATVRGNLESTAVPTSVLVRVAHELLQAGHRTAEEFSAGHAVGAINVPYMFKVGSEKGSAKTRSADN